MTGQHQVTAQAFFAICGCCCFCLLLFVVVCGGAAAGLAVHGADDGHAFVVYKCCMYIYQLPQRLLE